LSGKLSELVRGFSPSWGAAVMGTGILAVCSKLYSSTFQPLQHFAVGLTYLNTLLLIAIAIPWVARWVFFTDDALSDLNHPVRSNFYPTLPIGMMVLACDYLIVVPNLTLAWWLWGVGAVLTLVFGVIAPYNMFKGEHVKLDHINPSWFIPPVGLIVIPVPGGLLLSHATNILRDLVLLLDVVGWGAGFFIYLALLAVCVYRFILHHPLPSTLAPTLWINLGPIGAGTVALYNVISNAAFVTNSAREALFVFGAFFWGSGLWWFAIAAAMTLHYLRKVGLPYAPSWWAFTFPLGAYVAATYKVSSVMSSGAAHVIGVGLYALLTLLWIVTAVKTLKCRVVCGLIRECRGRC